MILLIKLLIAHMLGDFVLQPTSWVKDKEKKRVRSMKLYLHSILHGLLVLAMLWDLKYWGLALGIAVLHCLIDLVKTHEQNDDSRSKWFFIDQALHIVTILGLWVIFFKPQIDLISWFGNINNLIYIAAILFLTFVSAIVLPQLMSSWTKELNDSDGESLSNAGKYIGILERLFVFLFIVIGRWEGVGFLLAAKSVFRFGDLSKSKDRKLTEYILIGTLLSFGFAMATGVLVLKLVKN